MPSRIFVKSPGGGFGIKDHPQQIVESVHIFGTTQTMMRDRPTPGLAAAPPLEDAEGDLFGDLRKGLRGGLRLLGRWHFRIVRPRNRTSDHTLVASGSVKSCERVSRRRSPSVFPLHGSQSNGFVEMPQSLSSKSAFRLAAIRQETRKHIHSRTHPEFRHQTSCSLLEWKIHQRCFMGVSSGRPVQNPRVHQPLVEGQQHIRPMALEPKPPGPDESHRASGAKLP